MHKRRHYIYPDLDTLAAAFVCDLSRFLHDSRKEGKEVSIALSGGSTPLAVFRQLVLSTSPGDWEHVEFFWGDERCVAADSEESNYGNALRLFLEDLKISPEQVHRIRGEEDPEKEAVRYSALLKEKLPVQGGFPVFDWIWLGLGPDGHVASIFPDQLHLMKADQICQVAIHPETGQKRITLTGGTLNAAQRIAFLVSGKSKSSVINEIVMKEGSYMDYPASYISPHAGYVEWYLDMDATSWM